MNPTGPAAERFVVFDLETDGMGGGIIEIGAVLCAGTEVMGEFDSLVRPEGSLQEESARLTGLTDGDLAAGPPAAEVLPRFHDFVGGRPLIAHNGFDFDFPRLDRASRAAGLDPLPGVRLDTLELAHLVFPRAGERMVRSVLGDSPPPGRRLGQLADRFGLGGGRLHRALNDARLTHRVMLAMLELLGRGEPARLLQRWVLARGGHPWARFFEAPREPPDLADAVPLPEPVEMDEPTGEFDVRAVEAAFRPGGALMEGREPRPQQADMARTAARALHAGGRHLIEAPTGTGKTLAYLVPAIEYARSSGRTVVISTYSRVLQNQILATLEELEGEIRPFNSILLKGMNNYLSLEALEAELAEKPAGADEALALAVVCGWAAETPAGDWEDLRTAALRGRIKRFGHLRWKLRVESPPGPALNPLDERDFYRRAREGLRNAHAAVLNHALLISSDYWLGCAAHTVIDEAHQLEDAATAALTESVGLRDLEHLCEAVDDPAGRSAVGRLERAVPWPQLNQETRAAGRAALDGLRAAARNLRSGLGEFGGALIEYVLDRTGAQRADLEQHGVSYHIRAGIDTGRPAYGEVVRRARSLRAALTELADAFNRISVPERLRGRYRRRRLEMEVGRLGRAAREAAKLVDRAVWAEEPEVWISIADLRLREGAWSWTLRRAPASVAPQLGELWQSLDAAVLTSATLGVGGSFDFVIRALGLGGASTTRLPTPFDRLGEHHLVIYTDYLPAPRGGLIDDFTAAEAAEIPRLFVLTGGRGLALMTARARLERVRDHARPHMEEQGLALLAQGDDSPAALVERMRAETGSSLLALRSFWEGIDIPGEALSLLVIEKVPFDSPADPVVGARMQALELRGRDPFADYLVPRAALRFTQGVGRLIRTNQDVGATVVLDNRLRRPTPYRDRIRRSLVGPPAVEEVDSAAGCYAAVAAHLGIGLDDRLWERIGAVPAADPWSAFLDGLALGEDDLADPERIRAVLERCREWLGFEKWRPGQLETMVRFMGGRDALAVLPTGSGKSLTFQLPALLSPGVTLVVSPLIALMNDQVDNLRARGVGSVAAVHSGVPQGEQQEILRGAAEGRYKLLYLSPERLWNPMFTRMLAGVDVGRIAVDEAHCISQWGHSFRPEYSAIPEALLRSLGEGGRKPVLAVTATAAARVQEEIEELLGLDAGGPPIAASPDRPEIRYYTEDCEDFKDRDIQALRVLEAFRGQSAVVYVPRRRDAVRLAGLIRTAGHSVRPYHAGLPYEERMHVEDAFRHGEIDAVAATKAFGLGIDKPDIALIIHLEMPASIEEYIQETGRAARGAAAGVGPETGAAVLLATPRDCSIHRYFIQSAAPGLAEVEEVWDRIKAGAECLPPLPRSPRNRDLDPDRDNTAAAVHYLAQSGAARRGEDAVWRGRITVVDDTRAKVEELRAEDPGLAERADALLEMADALGGVYHAESWTRRLGRSASGVGADLLELNRRQILGFAPFEYAMAVERLPGAEPDWARIEAAAEQQRAAARERSEQARRFARRRGACRRRAMLEYLDAPAAEQCGGCDACVDLPRPWRDSEITREAVIEALPVRQIALRLAADTAYSIDGAYIGLSEANFVRTLVGDGGGEYPLGPRERSHPCFGRLEILGREKVKEVIEGLVEEGLISREEMEYGGRRYKGLAATERGEAELSRMG